MSAVPAASLKHDLNDLTVKPVDMKLNVKPLCISLVHTCAYEGPCRAEGLALQIEAPQVNDQAVRFVNSLKAGISKEATLMEPAFLTHDETFTIEASEWKKLQADASEVDVYVDGTWPGRAAGIERYGKPIVALGSATEQLDIAAAFRARGAGGYAAFDVEDLNQLVSLLRIRKALANTALLLVTDRLGLPPCCVLSSMPLPVLHEKLGIRTQVVSYQEFFDNMDAIAESREGKDRARAIADKVVSGAAKVNMNPKHVVTDALFYLTAVSLMNRYRLNAFAIDCIELCGTQIPNRKHFTPCLTHTLLKDQGIPSACENDMNAFAAMAVSTYTTRKSVYMGNPDYLRAKRSAQNRP